MKIRALRLAEVGPFSEGVALEGLSGGLDVLTGPNETGKSTLFAALGMLLSERHTSTAQKIAAMRPDAGGAPLVEADIEIGGRRLRLRKRFLALRTAMLKDLGSGEIWHGADAETMAEQLLGGEGRRQMRGLLWVEQGASFALPKNPDATLTSGLAALIEREAADAAGAGQMRVVGAAVRARLEQLVTAKTGKAKTDGPLFIARRDRDALQIALSAATAKATAAENRLSHREALAARRLIAGSAETQHALGTKAEALRKAVEEANRARDRLRLASERVDARRIAVEQAKGAADRYARLIAEAQRAADGLAESIALHERLTADLTGAEAQLFAGRAELDAAESTWKAARADLQAAHAAVARQAAMAEYAEADRRIADARAAMAAVAEAEGRLTLNPVDEKALETIRGLAARLHALDMRILAELPRAAIAYVPGSASQLYIDGVALADGTRITIDRRTDIVIEGIGTITIEPGETDGRSPAAERDACTAELDGVLARLNAADPAAAQARLDQRRLDEKQVGAERARLGAAAPKGIAALEVAHATAHAKVRLLSASRDGDAAALEDILYNADHEPDIAAIEQRVRESEAVVHQQRTAVAELDAHRGRIMATIAATKAQSAAASRRAAEIAYELPAPAEREMRGRELAEMLSLATAELNDAVQERTVWAENTLQGADHEALVFEAERAADAVKQSVSHLAALDRDIAELDGALGRDGEDGAGAEVARLEEALSAADARLADLETDRLALGMLAGHLERIGTDHRHEVLRPLVERLQPLLGCLFPEARLTMDGPLLTGRLERPDRSDPAMRVSGGTAEQIATLVRIAYAELMAARGIEMPLVLDDALAFSDDRRLEIMIELLSAAARRHQVIVLSCHQRAIDPLMTAQSAQMLTIVPWRDAEEEIRRPGGKAAKGRRILATTSAH